jgi:hypothetical protein
MKTLKIHLLCFLFFISVLSLRKSVDRLSFFVLSNEIISSPEIGFRNTGQRNYHILEKDYLIHNR